MATSTRNPTSDEAVSGTWTGSAGSRYTLVNDHPDSTGTSILAHGTTAGNLTFGFSAFSIPAESTGISVEILYYDKDASNGNNNAAGRLKVNGVYYGSSTHNPGSVYTLRTDTWATNPNTSAAWTVADVNGTGSNPLQAFGWVSTDATPAINFSSIQLQVTYTPPISATLTQTESGNTVSSEVDIAVVTTTTRTQGGDTISSTGTVAAAGINAALTISQDANTVEGAGALDIIGAAGITQGAGSVTSAALVDILATTNANQGGDGLGSTSGVLVLGQAAITENANTISSDAAVAFQPIAAAAALLQANNSIIARSGEQPSVLLSPNISLNLSIGL